MAGKSKLSSEEQAYFDTPPEPTPLDEEGDRTPAVEIEPDEQTDEVEADVQTVAAKPDETKGKKEAAPADDKTKKEPEKQKTVPHGAMEAERQRRKALEVELAKERREATERQTRLDERLRLINEALAPKQEPPAVPDPEQDIFAYVRHLEGEIQAQKGMSAQERQQAQQRQQAENQNRQLMSAYMADAQSFASETPDFMEAYRHLLASRDQELSAMGYNPMQRQEYIRNDEMNIAQSALAQGRSAAETIYNLAKLRGFSGKPPAQQQEQPEAPKTNGADKEVPDAGKEIERLAANQEAAGSLSNAGSTGGGAKITMESIDRMKPDEFKAFVAKINAKDPKGYDRLMGKLMLGS